VSYSTELAKLVAGQLARFVTLNRHQLAGQVANLDFWLDQVRHALAAIDGYGVRFVRLDTAQRAFVAVRGVNHPDPGDGHTKRYRAAAPHRVPNPELRRARRELVEAACRFLDRCHQEGLISDGRRAAAVRNLGGDEDR
jgi:hypothetical protein